MKKFIKVLGIVLFVAWVSYAAYLSYNTVITYMNGFYSFGEIIDGIKMAIIGLTVGTACLAGAWAVQYVGDPVEIDETQLNKLFNSKENSVTSVEQQEDAQTEPEQVEETTETADEEIEEEIVPESNVEKINEVKKELFEPATEENVAELNEKIAEDAVADKNKEIAISEAMKRAEDEEVNGDTSEKPNIIRPRTEAEKQEYDKELEELKEAPEVAISNKPVEREETVDTSFFIKEDEEEAEDEIIRPFDVTKKVEKETVVQPKEETSEQVTPEQTISEESQADEKETPVEEDKVEQETANKKPYVSPKFKEVYKKVGGNNYDLRKAPLRKGEDGLKHINIEGNFFKFDGKGNVYDDEPWSE